MKNILDVNQSLCAQRKRKTDGVIHKAVLLALRQHKCRIYGNGVARMDAGPFDVFHNSGNQHILAVADGVHFQLRSHQVLVYQNGIFNSLGQDNLHVFAYIAVVISDNHILAA